ncbi:MAG TPA: malto-oligosyltrehalose trehalohydrolase [Acidimicrobiales bacterium]|nr:malto-oligosyltrehalose trehalohydrolase [Acidimicrobiales bacterium]
MTTFRVWAPSADRVDLDLGGHRVAMEAGERGWWTVEVADAEAGADYGFCLDGSDPLPDPRSSWQPEGVHGPSRLVDHAFAWTDQSWTGLHLPAAVLYELHVGTFSPEGTFDGAIQLLDHLVDLGVNAVELLPVAEFSGMRGWGYDGVDLYAPHHAYGGPAGLKRFVDACHNRGLGVVLDVVYNHLGPEGNHLGRFGPYFTDFYATPWGQAVNYDQAGSDEVRRFAIDNAVMWLRDYHLDGLRLDAVQAIIDTSAVHVLEQMAAEVEELAACVGRPLFLIGESDLHDPRLIDPRGAGGLGLDAQWSDDLHHCLRTAITDERRGYYVDYHGLVDLAACLERGWPHAGDWSPYRQRTHGRPFGDRQGWKLLAYSQNHDQIGNRAQGDRLSQVLAPDRLAVAAALVLTSPFLPMVFQGEEWGATTPFQYFTSHEDPELGRAVSQGRRSEFSSFGWKRDEVPDPQEPSTFERSKLDWDEVTRAPHAELLEWYTKLIGLRRSCPALCDGRLDRVRATADVEAGTLVVERGPVTVVANLGSAVAAIDLAEGRSAEVSLASSPGVAVTGARVTLPPDSVVVMGAG